MNLFGMQLSIMNVMGLPMIIGIGIDDGVHIMHRWMHEGKGNIRMIFSSTGKAVPRPVEATAPGYSGVRPR